jgi:hypothetical protein
MSVEHPQDGRKQPLDLRPLRVLLAEIEETYRPLEVWLFGSRARGDARPDSPSSSSPTTLRIRNRSAELPWPRRAPSS